MKSWMLLSLSVFSVLTVLSAHGADGVSVPSTLEGTIVKPLLTADVIVIKGSDGTERPIRLFGVATPVAGQLHAQRAIDFLAPLVKGLPVTVEILAEDNEGLPVAWIRGENGIVINEQLIQAGLAWWDENNAPEANRLKKLAAEALVAGTGLWKDSAPLAPWDYRTSHNLPPVSYTVETESNMEESLETVEPMVPTLAAKGTPQPPSPAPAAPVEIAPEDYLSLAAKHQPHIARDPQGNALGLTASDITSIPGASQLGFQNGDIVRSINGIALTNEAQLFGLVS